jgi:hypothetical protein
LVLTELPLAVLISPFVIALMAVALMGFAGRDRINTESKTSGRIKNLADSFKMRLLCYLGGHPDVPGFYLAPVVVFAKDGLLLFERRGQRAIATLPWAALDQWQVETLPAFEVASGTVRGLDRAVLAELPPDCLIARFRYRDDNGWWQNVALGLHGPDTVSQIAAMETHVPLPAKAIHKPAPGPDEAS